MPLGYFELTSPSSFSISFLNQNWDGTLYTSTNNSSWSTITTQTRTAALNSSDGLYHLYLRGSGNKSLNANNVTYTTAHEDWSTLQITGSNVTAQGNIYALLDYSTAASNSNYPSGSMSAHMFRGLFYGDTALKYVKFELNSSYVPFFGYSAMFCGSGIIYAPELPATSFGTASMGTVSSCGCNYLYMFINCTSLIAGPKTLPALSPPKACYEEMFSGCTNLKTVPIIAATTYPNYITGMGSLSTARTGGLLGAMFASCSSIRTIPELLATSDHDNGVACAMCDGCTSTFMAKTASAVTSAGYSSSRQYVLSHVYKPGKSWGVHVYGSTEDFLVNCSFWTSSLYSTTSNGNYLPNGTYYVPGGYTIAYISNEGSSVSPSYYQTKLPNTLPTPTRSGYVFGGWYKDSNFTTAATAGSTITWDTPLYAKWLLANPITYANQTWSATESTSSQTKTLAAATNAQGTVTYAINSQPSGNYFSLSGTTLTMAANTPAGTYSVVVRATAAGNSTYASGYADSTVTVTVTAKLPNPITYANQTWSTEESSSSQTKTLAAATNAQGTVTYALQSQSSGNYFTFNTSSRVLTMAANTPAGSYSVVIRATAAGNASYNSGYADSTVSVTVTAAPPVTTVFTIDGVDYDYDSDMTLAEWVESNYNVDDFFIVHDNYEGTEVGLGFFNSDGDTVCMVSSDDGSYDPVVNYILSNWDGVLVQDLINQADSNDCYFATYPVPPFVINNVTYQFDYDMTYEDWMDSNYNTNNFYYDGNGFYSSSGNDIYIRAYIDIEGTPYPIIDMKLWDLIHGEGGDLFYSWIITALQFAVPGNISRFEYYVEAPSDILVVTYNGDTIYSGNDTSITLITDNTTMEDDINIVTNITTIPVDFSEVTAIVSDVISGKYFYNDQGTKVQGTKIVSDGNDRYF